MSVRHSALGMRKNILTIKSSYIVIALKNIKTFEPHRTPKYAKQDPSARKQL